MKCRICRTGLPAAALKLGDMPLANEFVESAQAPPQEAFGLSVARCGSCGLWQLDRVIPPERLYRHYIYVSSTSVTVGRHAQRLAAEMIPGYELGSRSLVMEIASNDGTVLQAFHARGIPVLGIEPARNIASLARAKGLETRDEFFSLALARQLKSEGRQARLILARHVCAHVDDIVGFLQGVAEILEPGGVFVAEFPYLGDLVENLEFDTIYHEHLSYFSVASFGAACERAGLEIFDVERIRLHGGSVLVHAARRGAARPPSERLRVLLAEEQASLLNGSRTLPDFAHRLTQWKEEMGRLVAEIKEQGGRLAGYGAAAKANTLLNYVPDVAASLECVLDLNPWKQGQWTPGTRRPVRPPEYWKSFRPTHLLLLAWNFQEEIREQMVEFEAGGGRFIAPFPHPEILPPLSPKGRKRNPETPVLVVGGTGLVGSALCRQLRENGTLAVALSRRIRKNGPTALPGDLGDRPSLLRAATSLRPRWVVHAAGFPGGVNACEKNPESARVFFLEGTRHLVEAARSAGAGIVLVSTDAVFPSSAEPVSEETPVRPVSKYGEFKLASEELVRASGLPHLIIRTSNVYGWDPETSTPNFLMQILRSMEAEQTFVVSSVLRATPTWAEDLAQAIRELMDRGETGIFHVVGSEEMTREEWARKAVAGLGLPVKLLEATDNPGLVGPRPILRLSTGKLSSLIRWKPHQLEAVLQTIREQKARRSSADSASANP